MIRDKGEAMGAIKLSGGGNQPPTDVDQLKLRERKIISRPRRTKVSPHHKKNDGLFQRRRQRVGSLFPRVRQRTQRCHLLLVKFLTLTCGARGSDRVRGSPWYRCPKVTLERRRSQVNGNRGIRKSALLSGGRRTKFGTLRVEAKPVAKHYI